MASFMKIAANNKQGYMWICIKDFLPDPVTGKRNQIKRRGETKKEAEARVDDAINSLKDDGIDARKTYLSRKSPKNGWIPIYAAV
jgi:hypothetical protein